MSRTERPLITDEQHQIERDQAMDRRSFMKTLATAAAAAMPGVTKAAAPAARATDSLQTIGIQLYTVRDQMQAQFEPTLRRIASIGYREVEFAGYFRRRPEEVRAMLDLYGLKSPAAHVGSVREMENGLPRLIDAAKIVGHEWLVLAWIEETRRGSIDDYMRIADQLNKCGEAAKAAGIKIAYHNHDFEFNSSRGQLPYDVLLQRTDPALVQFELDIYWMSKSGQRPLQYFTKWPGRFALVHVKDMAQPPGFEILEVGSGIIDFQSIFARRRVAGMQHYFVEQDDHYKTGDPMTSAKTSYDYLSRLSF